MVHLIKSELLKVDRDKNFIGLPESHNLSTYDKVDQYGKDPKTGRKWQNKCVNVHLIGNETVHIGDG